MTNFAVLQSGGPTPVINRSLTGIIRKAKELFPQDCVFGARHGIEGLISDELVDLTALSKSDLNMIDKTPGAALGSTRHKVTETELPVIIKTLIKKRIDIVHIIGGNDSAETGLTIQQYASKMKHELQVINVPKTIDNDLVETDHCPGFGSTAKFIALATFGIGKDAMSMGKYAPIAIMEVMGRDTGWLAAAAGMLKNSPDEPPHFIGIPEQKIDEKNFIDVMDNSLTNYGYAVAVVAENSTTDTQLLSKERNPYLTDDFGHQYHDSIGQYLSTKLSREFKVRCRFEKPGTIQRSMIALVSETDYEEAHLVGQAAVEAAKAGQSNIMINLNPLGSQGQKSSTGTVSLEKVASRTRTLPKEYQPDMYGKLPDSYKKYLNPIIGQGIQGITRVL